MGLRDTICRGGFEQRNLLAPVLGFEQCFEQAVEVAFGAITQNKKVIPREPTGMVAAPQDQVVGLGDNCEFFDWFHDVLSEFVV
jgi:hypothetical protein